VGSRGISRRRLARSYGWGLALSVVLAVGAATPAPAAPLKIRTKQISPPSPFSASGVCGQTVPGFSPGYAQETSLAVDPRDPDHILVAWIQDGRATDVVMASRNGGRSFSRVLMPSLSACTGGDFDVASDPGVEFSANGRTAYFSAIVVNIPENPLSAEGASTGMYAYGSRDAGFSWPAPSVIQGPTNQFWDLPRLTPHPRKPKVAYYAYNLRQDPPTFSTGYSLVAKTTDAGRTWSPPRKMYDPQIKFSWPGVNRILVNDDGSLLNVFPLVHQDPASPEPIPTLEQAVRSVNGGAAWSGPITIGSSNGRAVSDPVTQTRLNIYDTYPSQTVAPNGDVYVSWLKPGATNASSQVAVARSTDGGRHWRERDINVNGQAALPTVEVAGDGTVGVLYYIIAPSSSSGDWPGRVVVSTSRDRGRHWRRHAVAGPFNVLTAGNKARPCCFLGDYLGADSLPNGIAFAFSMGKPVARNNVDAYFTRVTTSKPGDHKAQAKARKGKRRKQRSSNAG
jgi:hypothetical protein